MKLGPLNSAIRAAEIVQIQTQLLGPLAVQKTPLLEALRNKFPEGRGAETGLRLTANNLLEYDPDAS